MTVYILDTNSVRLLGNYYPGTFPTFWENLDALVGAGRLLSVREVFRELQTQLTNPEMAKWVTVNEHLFAKPTEVEMGYVAEILAVPHFQQLIGQRQRLRGTPVADPFLIAKARTITGTVVTEETVKPHSAKIPDVCNHFNIPCFNVQGMLQEERWTY